MNICLIAEVLKIDILNILAYLQSCDDGFGILSTRFQTTWDFRSWNNPQNPERQLHI